MLGETEEVTMKNLLIWLAVVLMLGGAVLLVAGAGGSALWIAVITVGIAIVVIDRTRGHHNASA
jgi:hypothetical protein